MTETLTKRETAQSLASLFAAFAVLQRRDMTVTSAQAVILAASGTVDMDNPRPATPSDVAKSLGMSLSAVTRLLAKLADPDGPSLLEPVPAPAGARSEGYVLTTKGRDFVGALLSAHNRRPVNWPETHTVATLSRMRSVDGPLRLRKVRGDEETNTLVVSPAEAVFSDEIQDSFSEYLSREPTIEVTKEGAVLKFSTTADLIFFILRWC